MKKRSKKALNISQDERPWRRVRDEPIEAFDWNKKIVRWSEGSARNLKTTILVEANKKEFANVFKKSLKNDMEKLYSQEEYYKKSNIDRKNRFPVVDFRNEKKWRYRDKTMLARFRNINKRELTFKEKNSCFFLGSGNSYNRKMLISRFAFRELLSFGLIAGVRST